MGVAGSKERWAGGSSWLHGEMGRWAGGADMNSMNDNLLIGGGEGGYHVRWAGGADIHIRVYVWCEALHHSHLLIEKACW